MFREIATPGRPNAALLPVMVLVILACAAGAAVGMDEDTLAFGSCEDTNLNLFLPAAEARALVASALGDPLVTPLFGGATTPLNIAHFHCAQASIGGRAAGLVNFALVRIPLLPKGHYVIRVLTDSRPLQDALRARGVESHLVADASLQIAGTTWTTNWGGEVSPYSVVAHQAVRRDADDGEIAWIFNGSRGPVRIGGPFVLTEEFLDRDPVVDVPKGSALRRFFDRSRGKTAVTHRERLELRFTAVGE
jgi:hypothetical protein